MKIHPSDLDKDFIYTENKEEYSSHFPGQAYNKTKLPPMKPLNKLFFPQMVLATATPERHVPQVLTGGSKRVISEAEWKAYEELERRPRKPGTNEYLTEGIVKSVDKTGK